MIRKSPTEEIPAIFDFRARLGELAAGAQIQSVDAITVSPDGELSAGTIGEAIIDQTSYLEVAVRLTGGVAYNDYDVVTTATVRSAGVDYVIQVPMRVLVI